MSFNDGDQIRIEYKSGDGVNLASLKVKKCTDGICQLFDVLSDDGEYSI